MLGWNSEKDTAAVGEEESFVIEYNLGKPSRFLCSLDSLYSCMHDVAVVVTHSQMLEC
jgi:hypothetical protein